MEQVIFSPADLPFLGTLQNWGLKNEWTAFDISYKKSSETQKEMEFQKGKSMHANLIKNIRKIKLRRLDEYKHTFMQFCSKRLSIARNSPQQAIRNAESNGKDTEMVPYGHEDIKFLNIPIVNIDAIQYTNISAVYSIGKYSQMNTGIWLGTKVTVRRMLFDDASSREQMNMLVPEIRVMGQIRHPYILLLLAATYDERHNLMLLYEHVDYGSLFVYLHDKIKTPSIDFMLSILEQIARVLLFLHQNGWIHTNLTSHAIQLMSFHRVKLSCFELAINLNSKSEIDLRGNRLRNRLYNWQAPEYYTGSKLDIYTDVYQFGLLTWEIDQKQIPWNGLSQGQLEEKYVIHKQTVSLKNNRNIPQLRRLLEKALSIRPKDRQLDFKNILQLLTEAKESATSEEQNDFQSKSQNLNTEEVFNNRPFQEKLFPRSINQENKKGVHKTDVVQDSEEKVEGIKGQLGKSIAPSQKCTSLEDFKTVVNTYTGLRRVRDNYFKSSNVFSPKMKHPSPTNCRICTNHSLGPKCHSLSSKWAHEAEYSVFSDEPERRKCRKFYQKDNFLHGSSSSQKRNQSHNPSINSSIGIKPASHSLEKQPSDSNSQEIFRSIGTSMPYRAYAIKPASHQSQRGFSRMTSKIITEASKAVINTNVYEKRHSSASLFMGSHNQLQRMEPLTLKNDTEGFRLIHNVDEYMTKENKSVQHLIFPNNEIKSAHPIKVTGISKEGTNLIYIYNDNKTMNDDKLVLLKFSKEDVIPDACSHEEPQVIMKICEQLLNMMKEPYLVKKEKSGAKIFPKPPENMNIIKEQTLKKDCNTKIQFNNAYSKEISSLQIKSPSMSFLTMLGLTLMDFYEDDEFGPSLWNDEHMQLRICQEFGKSLETFINVEEFLYDQHNENNSRNEDEDIESDIELNSKCKFNSVYYTLV